MNFIELITPYAVKYMRQEGILASLTLAQAILESDSGKSELAVNANNLFGIKAKSPWIGPVYEKKTKEYANGKWIEIVASFCKFSSLEGCFDYRSSVFLKREHYMPLWGVKDYKEACRIIYECGYATDPNYPQKLIDVIERNELYKYDKDAIGMVKIFIDPGHGGIDSGAVGNGLLEKNLTLQISKRIQDLLQEYENIQVKLSRESDQSLSLKQRTDMANAWGADFLLSVHINAGGGTGYEDFIYPAANSTTQTYQNILHDEITKVIDLKNRGKKKENFHMLCESKMPAFLSENGFIDNASDAAKLKQAAFIEKVSQGHVNGVVKAFKLNLKAPSILMWGKTEFKKGQIGKITILKPINLWTDGKDGKLEFTGRTLQPNEEFRVYGYRDIHGGQYDVGANHWITKMDGYIKYETPSKALLSKAAELYK